MQLDILNIVADIANQNIDFDTENLCAEIRPLNGLVV